MNTVGFLKKKKIESNTCTWLEQIVDKLEQPNFLSLFFAMRARETEVEGAKLPEVGSVLRSPPLGCGA